MRRGVDKYTAPSPVSGTGRAVPGFAPCILHSFKSPVNGPARKKMSLPSGLQTGLTVR